MTQRILLTALAVFAAACAHVTPTNAVTAMSAPAGAPNPTLTVNDRGSMLEVMPQLRARAAKVADGAVVTAKVGTLRDHILINAEQTAPISPSQPGIVFNHTLKMYGLINGEISFKLKPGRSLNASDAAALPGLAPLVAPSLYVTVARSNTEFVELVRRLQAREEIEWVEPQVKYGTAAGN